MDQIEEKHIIQLKDGEKPQVPPGKTGKIVFREKSGKVKKVVTVTGQGLTEQAHKKECDMNYILKDYHRTGLIKHAQKYQGRYDDVTVTDFQDAMFLITEAQKMFNDLPANIRDKFKNDPGKFLQFVQNPDNKSELKSMGILQGNDGLNSKGEATTAPVKEKAAPVQENAEKAV